MPAPLLVRVGSSALVAFAVVSCGPGRNEFAPACPIPGVVKPLAQLDRYRGGSQDIRNLVVRARIVDIVGKCKPGDRGSVVATAQVVIDVTRGPGMDGLTVELPVFVAVTDTNTIRDKTLYPLRVVFERNQDTTRVASREIEMTLPVTQEKSGAAYGIIAGFQLSPEEVEAYRRSTHR